MQEQERDDSQHRWKRMANAFESALALTPDKRPPLLDAMFGTTGATRDEVDAMLAASDHGGTLRIERLLRDAAAAAEDGARLSVGTRIGPWCVEALHGAGGMGDVYRAQRVDGAFEQRVAIKVMRSARGPGAEERTRRFESERRILARLEHPDIVAIIDGGWLADGRPYFVMPLVEGTSLQDYCQAHSLPVERRLALLVRIARAVGYAHAREIVHRDLKPSNVLVGNDGRPHLLDFGVAKLLSDDLGDQTRTGALMLTPRYAAPEQLRGAPVSPAADVYALGVMLRELLSATHDAVGAPLVQEATRVARRALDPDSSRRYRDGDELADVLACALDRHDAASSARGRHSAWRRRMTPRLAVVGVVASLAIGSAAFVALRSARHIGTDASVGAQAVASSSSAATRDSTQPGTHALAGASTGVANAASQEAPGGVPPVSASSPVRPDSSGAGVERGALPASTAPPNIRIEERQNAPPNTLPNVRHDAAPNAAPDVTPTAALNVAPHAANAPLPGARPDGALDARGRKVRDARQLAVVYGTRGLTAPAIALMDSVVDRAIASEGSTSVQAAYARAERGLLRVQAGALDSAARDLAFADSLLRRTLPRTDTLLADVDLFVGTLDLWRARPDSALVRFQASHAARALSGGAHPKRAAAACGIALALAALDREAEAKNWQTFCRRQRRWSRGYDAMVELMQGAARRVGSVK